jgi:hypothetical protein
MNALGISLVWIAVQVTLFCLAGTAVYLIARRRSASGASVLCGILVLTVGIAALSVSPWPSWWTLNDLHVPVRKSGSATAETPLREKSPSTDATNGASQNDNTLAINEAILDRLAGIWSLARGRLADSLPPAHGNVRWRWPAWLAIAILSGSSVGLARVLLGIVGLAKLLRTTRPVDDPALLCLIEQLRSQLHCRRTIEVREMTCSGGGSPAVVGWRRPIILLPANWRMWSEETQRGILAHETAHVAHGDFLMWLAAQAGVVVHFYNPLVHWLAHRLRLEQELAADARGAALCGGAKAYATLLAQMALGQDELRPLWAGRPFFPTRGTLMRRIEMLTDQRVVSNQLASHHGPAACLAILLLTGVGVCGLRLPIAPAFAAEPLAEETNITGSPTSESMLPAFDDSYLPADTIAVLSVKPLKVASSSVVVSPVLLSFPSSFNLGFSTADNGVDEVRDIVFSPASDEESSPMPDDSTEPGVVEIYRMREPYERSKLRVKIFGQAPDGVTETTCHGYPCFQATSDVTGLLINYLLVDDRTLVIMRDRDVPRVLAADPKSHPSWYDEWRKIADRPLAVAFDTAAMNAIDNEERDSTDELVWSYLKETSLCVGCVESTADGLAINATALCKSPQQAAAASQLLEGAFTMACMAVPEPSALPKEYQTLDMKAAASKALASLKMGVHDAELHLDFKFHVDFAAQFAEATKALIDRQTEEYKVRETVDAQAHITKLGRLVEALNAYHDEHGHYPPAAVAGPDGKTLHSWRVELLPYLGEQKLFEEYKLDEPWDSEHNKPLIEKIPNIFSTSIWTQKGKADYFVVTGKGTLFDSESPGRRESISDAPGETILVLQSDQRIPWTKPADIETSPDHEAVRPFRGHGKGFYAAFADGTIKFVSNETDAASVRATFTKAGGDEVKLR